MGITMNIKETRLIDANALLRNKRKMSGADFSGEFWDEAVLASDIENAPTINAMEVVRCRECKYHYWEQEPCHGKTVHYCKLPHMRDVEVFKEFFCYYGERREGADND